MGGNPLRFISADAFASAGGTGLSGVCVHAARCAANRRRTLSSTGLTAFAPDAFVPLGELSLLCVLVRPLASLTRTAT